MLRWKSCLCCHLRPLIKSLTKISFISLMDETSKVELDYEIRVYKNLAILIRRLIIGKSIPKRSTYECFASLEIIKFKFWL